VRSATGYGLVDIEWEVTSRNVQAGELSVEFVAVTTYEGVPEGLSLPYHEHVPYGKLCPNTTRLYC
jgi:hypothetical protein